MVRTISVMCPSLHESVVPQTNKDNPLYSPQMSFRELFSLCAILICVFHAFFSKKDPCPHVPRCSHERTLSALRRQKRRFKTEEELKKQEVCVLLKNKTKQRNFIHKQIKLQKYCPQLARVCEAGQCVQNMKFRLRLLTKESLQLTLGFLSLFSQFRS